VYLFCLAVLISVIYDVRMQDEQLLERARQLVAESERLILEMRRQKEEMRKTIDEANESLRQPYSSSPDLEWPEFLTSRLEK